MYFPPEWMIMESKLSDFLEQNGLTKDDALKDDNVKKIERLLKVSDEKAKAKIEKYFETHTAQAENESEPAEVPAEVEAEADKLDDKQKKWYQGLLDIISNAAKNYAKDETGNLLDELFVGNFKDAVIGVYEREMKAELDSDEKAADALEKLKGSDDYKKAQKSKELDSRKDTETSTDIDRDSARFTAMWYSSDKDQNVGVQLSELVKQIQAAGKKLQDDTETIKSELKKAKIDLSDEEIANYGPALAKLVADKTSPEDMKKAVDAMKKNISESMRAKILKECGGAKMLRESNYRISESLRTRLMFESVCENEIICEAIAERMIEEGWFGDAARKAMELAKKGAEKVGNSEAMQKLAGLTKQVGAKIADVSKKGMEACTKYSIGPMLSLGGIGLGVITGGWGAELIIKAMDLIEKQGKQLRNSFERVQTMYANSKGVITKMDYTVGGDKDKTYSMRFYDKDMVWRVLNTSDQLKHPGKDYVKQIVNGDVGKKYRERLKAVWDPLFSDAKGGKVDFVKLFEQAKNVDIPEKALQLFQQFSENYDTIVANCVEQPKIDTRAQNLKG